MKNGRFCRFAATVLLVLVSLLYCGVARASYPVVRNFKRAEYNGGAQNWDVVQAADGSMIFGNSYGALCYSGASWLMLPVSNNTTVRSILCSETPDGGKRVYVGASGEMGYFYPSPISGFPLYKSLRSTLNDSHCQFNEIWNYCCPLKLETDKKSLLKR